MIWVVIPAFNEEEALPTLLPKISNLLSEKGVKYHLIVVNDGSSDNTLEILENFQKQYPLTIINHKINRGLGETERDGFEMAGERCADDDYIVRVEADATHDPKYIFDLIAKLDEGYDVVNTSRFQPGGGQIGVTRYRATISRLANLFMKLVLNIPGVADFSCGFRAYRGRIIRDAIRVYGNHFIQLRGLGFTSTLEIIVKLHLLGARFAEVPFVLRYDLKESSSKMIGSITTFGYMTMAMLYHWPFRGWTSIYRGLGKMYREDSNKAVEMYRLGSRRRRLPGHISF